MKYCKQCDCHIPDDYEDDICPCCYEDMNPRDDELLIPSESDKEYSEKILHRRGVI